MSEQEKVYKVYKSHKPYLQLVEPGVGSIVFRNHKIVTDDPKLIKYIEEVMIPDIAMGVYVDPNESETTQMEAGTNYQLRKKQIEEFISQQSKQIDAGNYSSDQVSTASSKAVSGKEMVAPRFTKSDTLEVLKAKAAVNKTGEEK